MIDNLDRKKIWDNTLVALTADHGYMLRLHGQKLHAGLNEVFHIPLLLHLPGDQYGGKRVGALTQNIDLMATILDHFGMKS